MTEGKGTVRLRLIAGGVGRRIHLGALPVTVAPAEEPPFGVDATVEEEDTYRVLSEDPVIEEPGAPISELLSGALQMEPAEPGSVMLRRGEPLRLLAIVHDLDRDPTWHADWIRLAMERSFKVADRLKLASISLPLLGTRYGSAERRQVVHWLGEFLQGWTPEHLQQVWLVVPRAELNEVWRALESEQPPPPS